MKELIPPILLRYITSFMYGWSGNYSSWDKAKTKCSGYNSDEIFDKVKNALLQVKSGEAVFERDSVIFDKVQYSFPLLSALSITALQENKKLNVLDFGGSMGSAYYQNKNILEGVNLKWSIVEQEHFVEEGKKTFADDQLNFYYTIDDCVSEQQVNIILLGSVLQYLENPWGLLDELLSKKINYIIIDRTPVFLNNSDRITIQKVPKNIYKAQYPAWILNEKKIITQIKKAGYELLFDADSHERTNLKDCYLKGYFFKLKN